jgi:predicted metalloprotease
MLWKGQRESDNVEDGRSGGSGLGGFAFKGGAAGLVLVLLISLITGRNPLQLLNQMQGNGAAVSNSQPVPASGSDNDESKKFVSVVLASTEDVWTAQFRNMGKNYVEPKLRLFRGSVSSACGQATAAVGPFYCPADQKAYIDLSFYDELKNRFRAPGDFAMAYVVAHEIGHHVQNLLGISQQLDKMRGKISEKEFNKLSVKIELQADFLAGVWAHHAQQMEKIIEPGDIDEALAAAEAIGDDKLQQQSQGYVVPDAFTHGTSAQRMFWFKKGFETGDVKEGDISKF